MNLTTCRRHKADDGSVSFPALQCWNPVTKVATIAAQVDGRRISCRIDIDILNKRFNTVHDDPMRSVMNHRARIENAAKILIEKNAFEQDGSIMIRDKDI